MPPTKTPVKKKNDPDTLEIPEDLTGLSDSDLNDLHAKASDAFSAMLPPEGEAPSDAVLEALDVLGQGVMALQEEQTARAAAASDRLAKAKSLSSRVLGQGGDPDEGDGDGGDEAPEGDADAEDADADAGAEDREPALVAAGRRPAIQVDLSSLRGRESQDEPDQGGAGGQKYVAVAAQGAAGLSVGAKITFADMAKSINERLGGFNASSYAMAASRGKRQSERFTIAKFQRQFPKNLIVESDDPREAFKAAADETRLDGGSLVASGGWCAPSETLYDLVDISEAENLVDIAEVQINRGGIRFTIGPDYRTVFADTGFCYTEEEDIDGDYDGAGGGSKPCVTVPCPDFEDVRLGYCGVCIGAGLLQQRGYPEVIEDYIGKALNAHAHRVSASVINSMVAESTAVNFPTAQAGAVAPLLTALDLQAVHFRAINRMRDDRSLEVVLPTWVNSVLRADLARRQGVDLLDVSDARIAGWFSARNINPQYVVDWQDISTTTAANFTAAPSGVSFLMFAAGTFVKGVTDSITMENIYDSVLLGTNDFTALFTEDPYLVAKRMHDSRVVNVGLNPDGSTHIGVEILRNGTASGAGS